MFPSRRIVSAGLLCLAMLSLTACKVSDDAAAAAEQMTATATELQGYYGALADTLSDTSALFELDTAISGIPYGPADRAQTEAIRAEILKREDLANGLACLAASFATLTSSHAPSDVQTAATALGNELIQVKALPDGSPIPEAVGKAGNLLLQIVQEHEEKKAAQAMDDTLSAVTQLFLREKPVYDSLTRFHLREAGAVARDLTNHEGVDPTPMLAPALKPFGLTPLPPSKAMQDTLKALALTRLQAATDEGVRRAVAASAAMLTALQEMSARVHTLATKHRMPERGLPFSLKTVASWVSSAGSLAS